MTDFELLQHYGRHSDQEAFATLVARHASLVHAAARRQVRSPHLAEEVTQTVFLELSRHALRIAPDTHIAGWLYVAARRRAIDAIPGKAGGGSRNAREFDHLAAIGPDVSDLWLRPARR